MSDNETICPYCKSGMTLVIQNRRKTFQCDKCDSDPLKSPKINSLLTAAALKPPLGS